MITLEEFKKEILGKETDSMTEAEINFQYKAYVAFADFAYKSWLQSRQLDITQNKK
jgi:hypothetical protein